MSQWLTSAGRELGEGLLHLFLPACCHVCGIPLAPPQAMLCEPCRAELLTDPTSCCPRCAASTGPFAAAAERCPQCRSASFAFDGVIRLGPYQGRLLEVVFGM
jgi:predicted amidophosphoribosyltransferase